VKGRIVAVVLVAVLALVAVAVWFAMQGAPAPVEPVPAPATGTQAGDVAKPAAKARERVRAGRRWIELGAGDVTGVVREYGTEKPLVGVAVTLSAGLPGPDRSIETRTGPGGGFRFQGVPNFEDWTVRVDAAEPLADVEQSGVSVVENQVTELGVLYVTPGFSVPGIVVDEQGQPLEGADVRVLRPRAPGSQLDVLRLIRELPVDTPSVDRAASGKDGRFVLSRTSPGTYDVKVLRAGRQVLVEKQVVITPDSAKRELRFVMTKGFALDGKLVRKGPGVVAGVPIVAFRQPQGDFDFLVLDRVYAVTDEEGKFHLDGLGAGKFIVAATPDGEPFALNDDVQIPATTWLELVLEGDAWIEGRVTGRGGAPVAGAQVFLLAFDRKPTVANARTDADGRYSVRGLKSGRVELFLVQAEDYAPWPTDLATMFTGRRDGAGMEIRPGRNEKDVSLEPGGVIRGVVKSKDDDAPLEGVRVELVSVLSMFGGTRGATTDALGKFEISSAPLGTAVLALSKEGWFQPGFNPMSVAMAMGAGGAKAKDTGKGYAVTLTEPGQAVERELTMSRGSTVTGQVVSPDGAPVAGARVELRPEGDNGMFGPFAAILGGGEARLTGADGRFEMPGPTPGTKARVVAKAAGFLEGRSDPVSAAVGARVDGIAVRLRLGASLEGRVTDERGKPVEGAMVRWLKTEELNEWEIRWRLDSAQPALSDADGRYRAPNVEPGKVLVQVTHAKHLPCTQKDVATEEGRAATFDAKLTAGAAIEGRVLGTDGRAFGGASVVLELQGEPTDEVDWADTRQRRVNSDGDGRFIAEGLAHGRWNVYATAKGAAPSETVTVTSGAAGQSVVLRLAPAMRIGGVARVEGAAAARVQVSAQRRTAVAAGQEQPVESWDNVGSDTTGEDGRFLIEDLPAGNYRMVFSPGGWGENRASVLQKTVDDVAAGNEGLVVDLDPGLRIVGRVTLEDGTPAPQGWVNVSRVSTDGKPVEQPANGWSQIAEGGFEVIGLPPGTYDVNVQVQNAGSKRVRAEAGGAELKIVVGAGAKVTGRVVLEDGSAASGVWVNAHNDQGGQGAVTDTEGRYTIAGLEAGRYRIDARQMRSPGEQRSGFVEAVETRVGDTVEAPTITLRPAQPERE
jgi:protocatechuate 3,4-dioxygenase beta subunit